jgi:hypothetical protein
VIAGSKTTDSAPSVFVRSDGEADVVAEGPTNSLDYYDATPDSAWTQTVIAGSDTTYSAASITVSD